MFIYGVSALPIGRIIRMAAEGMQFSAGERWYDFPKLGVIWGMSDKYPSAFDPDNLRPDLRA